MSGQLWAEVKCDLSLSTNLKGVLCPELHIFQLKNGENPKQGHMKETYLKPQVKQMTISFINEVQKQAIASIWNSLLFL